MKHNGVFYIDTFKGQLYFFSHELSYGFIRTKDHNLIWVRAETFEKCGVEINCIGYYEVKAIVPTSRKDDKLLATSIRKISKAGYDRP